MKKLKRASAMNIPEKEEAINAIEQEVKELKEKNSITGKLAVMDSKVSTEHAVLNWVRFEDIFTEASDYDKVWLHNYGEEATA